MTDHINAVIEAIKTEEIATFNMLQWRSRTTACVGGMSDLVAGVDPLTINDDETAERLGLTTEEGGRFFYAFGDPIDLEDITKEMAVRAYEFIRDNGTFTAWSDFK